MSKPQRQWWCNQIIKVNKYLNANATLAFNGRMAFINIAEFYENDLELNGILWNCAQWHDTARHRLELLAWISPPIDGCTQVLTNIQHIYELISDQLANVIEFNLSLCLSPSISLRVSSSLPLDVCVFKSITYFFLLVCQFLDEFNSICQFAWLFFIF